MINARESLDLLLSSNKLDGLLAAARTKVAVIDKRNQRPDAGKQASELALQVEQARAMGSQVVRDLSAVLAAKLAARADKVAIVRHLLHIGSKIQPA